MLPNSLGRVSNKFINKKEYGKTNNKETLNNHNICSLIVVALHNHTTLASIIIFENEMHIRVVE